MDHPRVESIRKIRICKPILCNSLEYITYHCISGLARCSVFLGILILASLLPMVAAMPEEHGFPNLTFKAFNEFIKANLAQMYYWKLFCWYCLQ